MFNIPEAVSKIIDVIHSSGEEAYIVGGCVRDMLMKREPEDFDITTSATPEKIKTLFSRTIDTGLSHGTVTIMIGKTGYEVTTYRIEGKYEDFRRPKEVSFTRNLEEDLLRRDFTINAMAYNHQEGLIDLYEGAKDIKKGLIRCVGKAHDRFNEDALRMLRAVRFAARFDFHIEEETYQAIQENARLILYVSKERIMSELTKTILTAEPWRIKELVESGLMEYVIPEFMSIVDLEQNNPYHKYNVDEHTYHSMGYVDPVIHLRWTMMLHDIGKGYTKTRDENGIDHFYKHPQKSMEVSKKILKDLRFDNSNTGKILDLIKYHDMHIEPTKKGVRRALRKVGTDMFPDLLHVKVADIKSHSSFHRDQHLEMIESLYDLYEEVIAEGQCVTIKDLALNGHDILELGIAKGKGVGVILNAMLDKVVEDPSFNTREKLIAWAGQEIKNVE